MNTSSGKTILISIRMAELALLRYNTSNSLQIDKYKSRSVMRESFAPHTRVHSEEDEKVFIKLVFVRADE